MSPSAQARHAKIRGIGYGVRSYFDLNFGPYRPTFGRAVDDDTDTQAGLSLLEFLVRPRGRESPMDAVFGLTGSRRI
jgi:hypothetical protein